MRLALTVVTPAAGQRAEVILDADPATPVGEVAAELAGLTAGVSGPDADGYGQVLAFPGPRPVTAGLPASQNRSPGWTSAPGRTTDPTDALSPGHPTGPGWPAGLGHGADPSRATGPGQPASHGTPTAAPRHRWPGAPAVFVDGLLVPPDLPLAASPLRAGCVISLGDPSGCLPPEPAGPVELRVVGGPAAGRVHRLSLGSADVGSGALAAVRILDPAVPAHALTVTVDARGQATVAAPAGAGVLLERAPLAGAAPWYPGQQLAVGFSLLELAVYQPPDAALEPAVDGGGLDFNRPPRLLPPDAQTRFQLPVPPTKDERRPLPILMAIVPVVMGVGMTLLLHEVYMLAMCVMSPVLMVGNHIADGKRGRRSFAQRTAGFREHKARIEQDAAAALGAERQRRMAAAPDPAAALTIATGPRRQLWERRGTDPDYLLLRLGTADLPSAVELQDPAQDEHRRTVVWSIPDAPVTVPLAERGVLGVAGPGDEPRALGRWLAAQIAVLHSPNDVQLCVLTDSAGQASWEWVRWLPHAQQPGGTGTGPAAAAAAAGALIGNDAETVGARIAELLAAISERQKILRESPASGGVRFGSIVVVLDGSRRLRWLPGVLQVLRDGPACGVYAICLDAEERLLPAECHAVAVAERGGLRVQQMNTATLTGVRPDAAAPDWCVRLARGIAPIRDISTDESSAGLPESSRLLDVLGLEPPDAAVIATRWRAAGRSTLAIVGEAYDGPFGIDIRRDGPHGLIAGTTGSGKSELLQTIVAALAVANRPDAMTFVLIDYKGGSAFKDCVRLPHTVGMVTDLDPHLVERALASLSAELTRREHILAGAGAKDIEDYTDLQERAARAGGGSAPLPRLMIVIDEFASMVRDLPDFVTGLVSIAQRGRSLGIHMLLATQRPSGVVSPEIRANTNLRIALRVTDTAESADVIDAPDAGHIAKSTPGRAYVRLGHSSLVPFQAGRVGGRRPGAVAATIQRPWLARLDWAGLGRPWPQRPASARAEEAEITDLTVLVRAICQASESMRLPAPHSPWLPALPDTLLLGDLPTLPPPDGRPGGPLPPVPYGLDDLPAQQDQRPAVLDLASFGHMMVAGAPRSGRSQLLRTMAGAVGLHHSCADVHLYGLDCGNGALLPIAELPHCGAVVLRTQPERATRLMSRLARELSRRQELLADGGFADIGEQRAAAASADERLPHILILLDRWEGFTAALGEADGGRLTETVTRILTEGASAGLHLVMTGDRSLIAGRISSLTDDKMVLRLPDRDDVNLVGLRPRDLPGNIPPGHGFRAGSGVETQVALLAPDASGVGQATALREIAAAATARAAGVGRAQRPFRVDVLPARLSFADAWPLRGPAAPRSPLWALVGVGGDDLAALGPDLADGMPAFIVGGPAKSGRSSVLLAMARSLLAAGTGLVVAAPRPSPLRALDGRPGVAAVLTGSDLTAQELTTALASLAGPAAVMIDDAEGLRDCGASDELRNLVAYGGDQGRALVFGGNAEDLCSGFGGWQVEARKARRGCLLSPQQITDGDLIGLRLPRSLIGEPIRPGRALLNTGDGTLRTVAVPLD